MICTGRLTIWKESGAGLNSRKENVFNQMEHKVMSPVKGIQYVPLQSVHCLFLRLDQMQFQGTVYPKMNLSSHAETG